MPMPFDPKPRSPSRPTPATPSPTTAKVRASAKLPSPEAQPTVPITAASTPSRAPRAPRAPRRPSTPRPRSARPAPPPVSPGAAIAESSLPPRSARAGRAAKISASPPRIGCSRWWAQLAGGGLPQRQPKATSGAPAEPHRLASAPALTPEERPPTPADAPRFTARSAAVQPLVYDQMGWDRGKVERAFRAAAAEALRPERGRRGGRR